MLAPYSFSHSLQDFIDICHIPFAQLFSSQISDDAPGTVAIQRASDSGNQAAVGEVQHGNTARGVCQYSPRSTRSTSAHVALYLPKMATQGYYWCPIKQQMAREPQLILLFSCKTLSY